MLCNSWRDEPVQWYDKKRMNLEIIFSTDGLVQKLSEKSQFPKVWHI